MPEITPNQMRAARLLLKWSRVRLAAYSDTAEAFVLTYEEEGRVMNTLGRDRSFNGLDAIRAALEAAGVEFVEENGGEPSVKLRKTEG